MALPRQSWNRGQLNNGLSCSNRVGTESVVLICGVLKVLSIVLTLVLAAILL